MYKRFLGYLVLALVLPVFLTGCIGSKPKVEISSDLFQTEMPPVTKNPVVDIYWDTSYSMAGYTTIREGNYFRELPDEVMDMASAIGEVKFFSYGAKISPLEGSSYHKLIAESAYTDLENSIKTVIDNAKEDHLSVVVTDLFETDAAWSAVTKKLQEKYFRNLYAVGVVALKAPFNGIIYDVGLDHAKFKYSSGKQPKFYRPVYMMVMGPDALVGDFLKRCEKKRLGGNSLHLLKLSSQLMASPANAKTMPELSISNIIGQEKLQLPEKSKAVEYKLTDYNKKVELKRSFDYIPGDYLCKLDFKQIKPVLKVRYYDSEKTAWKENKVEGFECSITPVKGKSNQYEINLSFEPKEALKEGTVNAMLLTLEPEYDGLVLPSWVQRWNLAGAASSDPTQFDGTRTVNLKRTMTSLKDSVLAGRPPTLVNLEMYFDLR